MRRTARALAAACQTALLLAAPPLALTRLVGRPGRVHLPDPVGPADPQQLHQLIIASAGLLSWLAWATIAVALLLRAGRRLAVALRRLPRLRLPGPLQGLSAAVLGTVTVTTAAPAAAHATAATSPTVLPPPTRAIPAAAALPAAAAPGRAGAGGQHASYTVRRGDTLWHIAGDWLGNPLRWPDIYQLNRAHYDQHGRMRHGDHIEPGWVLVLPDGATPPAGAAPAPPPAQPSPMQPQPPAPAPSRVPAPSMSASPSPSGSPSASTGQPDDPGAVAAPGFTGTATAAASPGPTATNASPPSRSPRTNPPGISLPGGSWVDLGLAAAIAAAAALVWIQRRRRYVPGPPSPTLRLDDPDLAPMPPVVTNVRRGLRRAAHGDAGLDLLEHAQPADADAPLGEPDVHDFGLYDPELDLDGQDAVGHDSAELDEGLQGDAEVPDEAPAPDRDLVPETPALDHALLQVWPPAGLGLTGPGGEAAVRGFLVAALAADGLDEPEARSRVVISAATLATLLGTEAVQVADTPRLTVTAGLPEALELLEAATLRRTRLADEHEVDTVAALRDADPLEEPLPPLLLIADATAVHQRARIASLLTQGQRLDIHGVLLGGWADGNIVHVAADGTTSRVDGGYGSGGRHRAHPADVGRLAVVDPTETADLLRTLAEAHTGQRQPAPPVEAVSPAVRPAVGTRNDEKATSARPDPADPTSEPIRADEKTLTGPGESPPADATDGEAIGDLAPARARAPASGLTPAHTVVDAVVDAMEPPRADRPGEPAGGLAEPVAGHGAVGVPGHPRRVRRQGPDPRRRPRRRAGEQGGRAVEHVRVQPAPRPEEVRRRGAAHLRRCAGGPLRAQPWRYRHRPVADAGRHHRRRHSHPPWPAHRRAARGGRLLHRSPRGGQNLRVDRTVPGGGAPAGRRRAPGPGRRTVAGRPGRGRRGADRRDRPRPLQRRPLPAGHAAARPPR